MKPFHPEPYSVSTRPGNAARRAFSLIEVTLAIGVVATGLVAVLAIIPQGLMIVRDAADTATEARIAQSIIGEINVTDWKAVERFNDRRLYFDAEGIQLEAPEDGGLPENVNEIAYLAKVEIGAPLGILPSAEESGGLDRNLLRVQVHLIERPLLDFDFADRQRFRTYSTVVARTAQ